VLNLQQPHDGGPVITDGHPSSVGHELVHATRPQRCSDCVGDSLAGVDVADELCFALFYREWSDREEL